MIATAFTKLFGAIVLAVISESPEQRPWDHYISMALKVVAVFLTVCAAINMEKKP